MAFSPDDEILASGGADDTVRLWNVRTHRMIGNPLTVRQLCAAAGQTLTRIEWKRHIPPGPTYQNVCPDTGR